MTCAFAEPGTREGKGVLEKQDATARRPSTTSTKMEQSIEGPAGALVFRASRGRLVALKGKLMSGISVRCGMYLAGSAIAPFLFLASPAATQDVPAVPSSQPEAADPATSAGPSDDIIVTAQKRSERVQDVAASIAVVTGDSLQKSGAVTYGDYLNSIPSVSYARNSGFKDKIFIRGLSDTMSSRVLSTTGVMSTRHPSRGRCIARRPRHVRHQPCRGPAGAAGTLFGSGSMGGTVRVITSKPRLDKVEGADLRTSIRHVAREARTTTSTRCSTSPL